MSRGTEKLRGYNRRRARPWTHWQGAHTFFLDMFWDQQEKPKDGNIEATAFLPRTSSTLDFH